MVRRPVTVAIGHIAAGTWMLFTLEMCDTCRQEWGEHLQDDCDRGGGVFTKSPRAVRLRGAAP